MRRAARRLAVGRVALGELPREPLALRVAVRDGERAQPAVPAATMVSAAQSAIAGTALSTTARSVASQSIDSAIWRPARARNAIRSPPRSASARARSASSRASSVRTSRGLGPGAREQRLAQQPRLLGLQRAAVADVADEAGEDRRLALASRVTDSSTGNVVPSARLPVSSRRWPMIVSTPSRT